jgi:hypothetical protein
MSELRSAGGALCARHPESLAGWRCERCQAALCPACTAWRKAGQGILETCQLCGGLAPPIRVRRASAAPFGAHSLWEAVRWPFHREGLLTTAACAIVLWLMSLAGFLAGLFAFGVVLSILFHVTVSTARGESEFRQAGDFRGFFEHVLGPLFRALLAAVWAYGPALAFFLLLGKAPGELSRGESITAVLLLLSGTFLFPCALLVGALDTPLAQILNPLLVIGTAFRLGLDYALVAGFALAVSLVESALHALIGTGLWQDAVLLLPAEMLFRALGLLVRARGDELAYGGDSSYLVPILGEAMPATELQPKPETIRSSRGA